MKLAFLYAGQGSQHAGMGADLYAAYPAFRAVFDAAPADLALKELCFFGPEERLGQTQHTQPCMVAFAAGMTALLRERGIRPDYAAGLSLGEYSALHAAGVFDAQTAIGLVRFRGRAMEQAARGRPGTMAAVLKLDRSALQQVCAAAQACGTVSIANYNCPGQLVIGGDAAAVERACVLALQAGVPVIPVYSAGNYQPFQRLQLRFGAPIVLTQRPNAAGVQEATQCLQEAMVRLQEELYLEMKPKYRTRAAEFHRRFRETTLRRQREQQKGERNHDA